MHKLIKHIKCSGQRQHPHSYFGNFTRMLNIGTNFLHPQTENTRISQILLGLSVCMWQTEDGNRNGARGSKTDVCVCVFVRAAVKASLTVRMCIFFWLVWQIGALGSVIEGTRTILLALFMRSWNVRLWYGVYHHNKATVRILNCKSLCISPCERTLINKKLRHYCTK